LIRSNKYWRYFENAVFIYAFFYISWDWVSGFFIYIYNSILGKGMVTDVKDQLKTHAYNDTFMTIVWQVIFIVTLWEISRVVYEGFAKEKNNQWNAGKVKNIFLYIVQKFKATFLASFVGIFIPMLIKLDVFALVKPFFNQFSLFVINFEWYSWIYAYLVWELSTWVWHYCFHRVRFFWCFHSPHHAPDDLTITTAWVHFFAEGFITTFIQWFILSLLGFRYEMLFPAIFAIEVGWGTFIHAGERSFKKGRLGFLKYFLITPSHHRVHHAKNPLYMDTNFCTFLPFWDWVFGTLQPLRNEVKIQYGITRKMDVTNFIDFYFGEFILLFRDIKNAAGIKNKLLYLIKPPGWTPESNHYTAASVRENFLQEHPGLGDTSRDILLHKTGMRSLAGVDAEYIKPGT
jgi:sterol desaturase/sphingolipid hydroxylase (fatty acid hydroxylase superfamily)